jgi:hypothetical protein
MRGRRLACRLLAHGDSLGAREELIGDLLEEIARGRSQWWVCQQLIGLYGLAFTTHLRDRARLTPQAVALALSVVLMAAVSMVSVSRVLEAWLGVYYVAGTLSLFAHMASRASAGEPSNLGDG